MARSRNSVNRFHRRKAKLRHGFPVGQKMEGAPRLNDPEPLPPYSERKAAIIERLSVVDQYGRLGRIFVGSHYCPTHPRYREYCDLLRMEKAGIVKRIRVQLTSRKRNTKFILVNPPVIEPAPRVAEPYKKRKEALKEFAELNDL